MVKKAELVNIKCPVCGQPLVTKYKGEDVQGALLHKCGKCKRYWSVNYTDKVVLWIKGKEESTPIKKWRLDIDSGNCYPMQSKKIDKALLRREGA